MNIKELLSLAGDQGKIVVVNDLGEIKGVYLAYEEYQKLVGHKPVAHAKKTETENEAEKINRAILEAQLKDETTPLDPIPTAPLYQPVERLDSMLSRRAEQLFKSMPHREIPRSPQVDMRSEVIDPNFDFSAPSVTNDDEVIRPNFDDI